MYNCLYCNIKVRKGTEKIFQEHENGYRHRINKTQFYKKKYYRWLIERSSKT